MKNIRISFIENNKGERTVSSKKSIDLIYDDDDMKFGINDAIIIDNKTYRVDSVAHFIDTKTYIDRTIKGINVFVELVDNESLKREGFYNIK